MQLTLAEAFQYLVRFDAGSSMRWIAHSRSVGMAALLLAKNIPWMEAELAASYGLLHDIGRAFGDQSMQIRHIFEGYHFLMDEGYPDAARICLTHSFPVQDVHAVTGVWDCTQDEYVFLDNYLQKIEYDSYDKLIQFCDNIALPEGIVTLEKRMVDIVLRYGFDAENTVARWEKLFSIRDEMEEAMGCSVEDALGLRSLVEVPDYFLETGG